MKGLSIILMKEKKSCINEGLSTGPYGKHWKAGEDKLDIGYKEGTFKGKNIEDKLRAVTVTNHSVFQIAVRSCQVDTTTEQWWQYSTIDDCVGNDGVHVVRWNSAIPNPRPSWSVNL
jgi:hypothetical protein